MEGEKAKRIVNELFEQREVSLMPGWLPLLTPLVPMDARSTTNVAMKFLMFQCNHSEANPRIMSEIMNNSFGNPMKKEGLPLPQITNDELHMVLYKQVRIGSKCVMMIGNP